MSFKNDVISNLNSLRYAIAEPLLLKYHRTINKFDYTRKDPLISVYVPTYNRGQILVDRAINSILKQTYTKFELIIVGDCCTDNTTELLSDIKDPRVRYYNIPKRGYRYPPTAINHWYNGPTVAANVALSMVKGDWIARNDDDDIWTEDHLEKLLNFAVSTNSEFVSSSYKTITYDGVENVVDSANDEIPIGGTQTWMYRSYLKFFKYNINSWRKRWNRVNDTDLQERMYKAGVKIGYLNDITTLIYPRPGETHIGSKAYLSKPDVYENFYK